MDPAEATREFLELHRKQKQGELSPAEAERWRMLKAWLGRGAPPRPAARR